MIYSYRTQFKMLLWTHLYNKCSLLNMFSDGPLRVTCELSESPNSQMFFFPNEDTGSSPVLEKAMLDSHQDLLNQELQMMDSQERGRNSEDENFIDDEGFDILDDIGAGIVVS